jgi:hypothetical protein
MRSLSWEEASVPHNCQVTAVTDPVDDELAYELSKRAKLGTGVAVVRPVPTAFKPADLAADVLMALGKHFDCLERERRVRQAWELATLWITAERIGHLVVAHADDVAYALWEDLYHLCAAAGADLWLLAADTPPRTAIGETFDIPLRWTGPETLLDALPPAAPEASPYRPIAMPLPDDDFLTFRASCRSLLTPERFARLDDVYRHAYHRTAEQDWSTEDAITATGKVTSIEAVATYLDRLTSDIADRGGCLVRLRAAQAALFAAGILVRLTPEPAPKHSTPTLKLTEDVAGRLRRLVSPELCAAGALSAAGAADAWRLTMTDIGAGRTAADSGIVATLPAYARSLVRAQILARNLAGAKAGDPFFLNAESGPASKDSFRRLTAKAATLVGLGETVEAIAPPSAPMPSRGWQVSSVEALPGIISGNHDRLRSAV